MQGMRNAQGKVRLARILSRLTKFAGVDPTLGTPAVISIFRLSATDPMQPLAPRRHESALESTADTRNVHDLHILSQGLYCPQDSQFLGRLGFLPQPISLRASPRKCCDSKKGLHKATEKISR